MVGKKTETKTDTQDIVREQPSINIGLVGHVDHGKTTLTERFTGKWTDTHSEELKRGITIRLGYADTIFYKCPKCTEPECFSTNPECPSCKGKTDAIRKLSFVDAPGHESLMATMLSGATIMDGALLLVAANEHCPQPQTREHLMALDIIGIKKIIVVQNKIDIVSEEEALANYKEIKAFLKETPYSDAPVIPISAQQGVNIDLLICAIERHIPTPKREARASPTMLVARSFDINRPGTEVEDLVGGVLGGSLKAGLLSIGDEIEIRPGRKLEKGGRTYWEPLRTSIVGLRTGGCQVERVGPGGSIGVMTSLDPGVVKSDQLAGSVVGHAEKLPPVWYEFTLETELLERVVGAKDKLIVEPVKPGEVLMLNVNAASTVGDVVSIGKKKIDFKLKIPVCADPGSRVTISRKIGSRWRLIGYGVILHQ